MPRGVKVPLYKNPTNCSPNAVKINLDAVKIAVIRALSYGIASNSYCHIMLIGYITPRDNNKLTIVMVKGLLILYTTNMLFPSRNSIINITPK